jgi:hypothetical protein
MPADQQRAMARVLIATIEANLPDSVRDDFWVVLNGYKALADSVRHAPPPTPAGREAALLTDEQLAAVRVQAEEHAALCPCRDGEPKPVTIQCSEIVSTRAELIAAGSDALALLDEIARLRALLPAPPPPAEAQQEAERIAIGLEADADVCGNATVAKMIRKRVAQVRALRAPPATAPIAPDGGLMGDIEDYLDSISDGTPDAPRHAREADGLLARLRAAAREQGGKA